MKKSLFSLVLLSLSFTACIADPGPIEEPDQDSTITEADSMLDQELFNRATMNSDSETCNDILQSELKEECIAVVDANVKISTALTELSVEPCKTITLERYKDDCENQVSQILDEQDEDLEDQAARSKVDEIEQALDLEACKQVEQDYLREQCLINISSGLAAREKDSNYCEAIKDYPQYDICLESAKYYGEPQAPQY